jgi:hypothetical protein
LLVAHDACLSVVERFWRHPGSAYATSLVRTRPPRATCALIRPCLTRLAYRAVGARTDCAASGTTATTCNFDAPVRAIRRYGRRFTGKGTKCRRRRRNRRLDKRLRRESPGV